jgi:hypothetical protein
LSVASRRFSDSEKELEENVLRDLEAHIPWDVIAKKHHISTKRIQRIKLKAEESDNEKQGKNPLEDYGYLGSRWDGKAEGEITAAAFKLFQRDVKPFAVAKRLELPSRLVKYLFRQYITMSDHVNTWCTISYNEGFEVGKESVEHIISWPCTECGENMRWDLNDSDDRNKIMGILMKGGIQDWHHKSCKGNQRG